MLTRRVSDTMNDCLRTIYRRVIYRRAMYHRVTYGPAIRVWDYSTPYCYTAIDTIKVYVSDLSAI